MTTRPAPSTCCHLVLHRGEAELSGCWVKLLVLGLALLFLGKQETVEPTLEVRETLLLQHCQGVSLRCLSAPTMSACSAA